VYEVVLNEKTTKGFVIHSVSLRAVKRNYG